MDAIIKPENSGLWRACVGRIRGLSSRWVAGGLTALFVALVFAVSAFQAPLQRFDRFAFFDAGGELAVQDLIRRGYRPTIDFGYQYGLMPLFLDRSLVSNRRAFELPGVTVEVMACAVLSAWGMARFAANRRVGAAGITPLMMLAIPDLISVTYMTTIHAARAGPLLINALAGAGARKARTAALASS